MAAGVNATTGPELWVIASDGTPIRVTPMTHPTESPVWTPAGAIACISTIDGRRRLTLPCDGTAVRLDPDLDVYGPVAISRDGSTAYAGMPNERGLLDLWAITLRNGRARRVSAFSADSYGASAASTGAVLFKVQSYRTQVAAVPSAGGATRPLATFRSETPSWDPSGRAIGITYGTWRRVVDDAHYPDIAQEAGIIDVDLDRPAAAVARVVQASVSEDQSLCWSPNGKWIAYHSHKNQSDDIWLRPAATPEGDRRLSFLGRGAEAGWPRWSPDGRWLLFDGASPSTRHSVMFVAGIDQESGTVTTPPREIATSGIEAEISHSEWLPDSTRIVAVAKEGPGRHVIFTTSRDGGAVRVVRRVETEHDAPALAASPDGREVAFVAPAPDGFFQIWRMPIEGATRARSRRIDRTRPSPRGRPMARRSRSRCGATRRSSGARSALTAAADRWPLTDGSISHFCRSLLGVRSEVAFPHSGAIAAPTALAPEMWKNTTFQI